MIKYVVLNNFVDILIGGFFYNGSFGVVFFRSGFIINNVYRLVYIVFFSGVCFIVDFIV